MRSRLLLSIVGLLMCLGCTAGPGAPAAANDPVGAVQRLITIVQNKQFDQIASSVCAAKRADIEAALNPAAGLASGAPGVNPQQILDAMSFQFNNVQVTEVSRTATSAIVQTSGTLSVQVDLAKMREVLRSIFQAQGQPVDDATLDLAIQQMTGGLQNQPIDNQMEVVNENGQWLVCDELTG